MTELKYSNTSLISVPITLKFGEIELAHATAFFYLFEGRNYLITNWHNVTGLHPDTLKPLSNHGGTPESLLFPLLNAGDHKLSWTLNVVHLYKDEHMEMTNWYCHPEFRRSVDVIAIEIDIPPNQKCIPVNGPKLFLKGQTPQVADEVYILGFP